MSIIVFGLGYFVINSGLGWSLFWASIVALIFDSEAL